MTTQAMKDRSWTKGPYRIGIYEGGHVDGVPTLKIMRESDGSILILAGEADESEQIAVVRPQVHVKRGAGWNMKPDADPEGLATAYLLAAAPDLYEAVVTLRYQLSLYCSSRAPIVAAVFDIADAALAKAEGKI